ncbi:MAG: amidohydrolase [Chitinispirillaceae bacterium]|nr:amidohydrolase [Chitinispirillaceae bacterium]
MIDKQEIKRAVTVVYPDVVTIRRIVHAHPELSGQERKTASLVRAELRKIGLKPAYFLSRTAVVCRIENGVGPVVVLRADTDALPVEEKTGLPFASCRSGIMHACGHDMHTAILIGAARVLAANRHLWRGSVVFLFQPSEEVEPGGAIGLIKAGAFPKNAKAVFGLHVNPEHRTGTIGIRGGSDFAGVLNFAVTLRGRGGHAAAPYATVNPILCAAKIISRIEQAAGQKTYRRAVIAVGTISAGSRSNIVPDQATFSGTIRSHARGEEKRLQKKVSALILRECRQRGATASVVFERSYPPNCNSPDITRRMFSVYAGLIGRKNVVKRKHPVYYAEDFAYYQQKTPGLFLHLGVRASVRDNAPGLHNARFCPDEKAMKTGMIAHIAFVAEMTQNGR